MTEEQRKESQRILKLSKKFIAKHQKKGSDFNEAFRKIIMSKGISRISFYNWFNRSVDMKTPNIDKIKQYLIDSGEEI